MNEDTELKKRFFRGKEKNKFGRFGFVKKKF